MARLVVPRANFGQFTSGSLIDRESDSFTDRLIKYIPAETVAFYFCVDRVVSNHFGLDFTSDVTSLISNTELLLSSWLIFCLALVGTPIYLWKCRLPNQPWKLHVTLSTVAFVCWAYSLGGSIFLVHGLYSFLFAGLVAPIFTFVAGWFEPRQESPTH